ncbi:MAG: TonB-dependent receptor, partial [Gemmatimonadaceae bacterium]
LSPQKSVTSEVGAKGYTGAHVRYDVAVFSTRVTDELVPFEIPKSNGRRYFRNAGRTSRRGAEAGGEIAKGPFALNAAYSYSAFRFDSYRTGALVYDGNTIPGVPKHHWQAAVRFSDEIGFAVLENEGATGLYLDDANTTKGPGYSIANFRVGTAAFLQKRVSLSAGVQNIFDRHYAASVAVNAARLKFFEPAATRNFFVGVAVSSAR